jgi:ABC-2 type transport system permease protein
MFKSFRAYPTLLRAYWALAIEYRVQILMWVLTGTYPLVMMAVWINLAKDGRVGDYTVADFIGYYMGVMFVRRITYIWVLDDFEERIRTGELSSYLLRPFHMMHQIFANIVAMRFLNTLIAGAIVAVVVLFVPGRQFDLHPFRLILFCVSIAIGFLFEFFLQAIVGTLAFWTTQVYRIFDSIWFVKSLMGGFVVPLSLLPPAIQQASYWLPFRSSMALPIEILTGRAGYDQAIAGIIISAVWVFILMMFTRWIWSRGLRSYSAVGA